MHTHHTSCTAVLSLLLLCPGLVQAWAGEPKGKSAQPESRRLLICPAPTGQWKADIHDVQHVLCSAAGELWRYFPERRLDPIIVVPTGGPIVWHRRGLHGEHYVRLNTGKTFWAQYAFQFAHEFCHILCRHERTEKANKWFEESICELASLFVLRRMAETWESSPPYPHWRSFAPHLRSYADERIKKSQLPGGTTLAAWYRQNEAALRKASCDRARNNIVATALLPLFEAEPQHWAAIEFLNAGARKQPRTFQQYLADWHRHAPGAHKPFIGQIARRFGIDLPPS